jgi:hypothetical protein
MLPKICVQVPGVPLFSQRKHQDSPFQSLEYSKARFFFLIIHLFTCAYIVWVISPPCPPSLPSPLLPHSVPGRSCSAFMTNFVEEKHKPNKEDKAFLLAKLRIAIQKYS